MANPLTSKPETFLLYLSNETETGWREFQMDDSKTVVDFAQEYFTPAQIKKFLRRAKDEFGSCEAGDLLGVLMEELGCIDWCGSLVELGLERGDFPEAIRRNFNIRYGTHVPEDPTEVSRQDLQLFVDVYKELTPLF